MTEIASVLVREGIVEIRKVEEAIQRQVIFGGSLDTVLLEMGAADEHALTIALAKTFESEPADVGQIMRPDARALATLGSELCVAHRVIPMFVIEDVLHIASATALDAIVLAELETKAQRPVSVRAALPVRISAALAVHFGTPMDKRFRRLASALEQHAQSRRPQTEREERDSRRESQRLLRMRAPLSSAPPLGSFDGRANSAPASVPPPEPAASSSTSSPPVSSFSEPPPPEPPEDDASPVTNVPSGAVVLPDSDEPVPRRISQQLRGPIDAAGVRRLLGEVSDRDSLVTVFLTFAQQFFDFSAVFVAQKKRTVGWDAAGPGADGIDVKKIVVPSSEKGRFARAVVQGLPRVTDLRPEGGDAIVSTGLRRMERGPCLLLPITMRGRTVMVLYGDRDGDDFEVNDVPELLATAPRVADALERIILLKKQGHTRRKRPPSAKAFKRLDSAEIDRGEIEERHSSPPFAQRDEHSRTTAPTANASLVPSAPEPADSVRLTETARQRDWYADPRRSSMPPASEEARATGAVVAESLLADEAAANALSEDTQSASNTAALTEASLAEAVVVAAAEPEKASEPEKESEPETEAAEARAKSERAKHPALHGLSEPPPAPEPAASEPTTSDPESTGDKSKPLSGRVRGSSHPALHGLSDPAPEPAPPSGLDPDIVSTQALPEDASAEQSSESDASLELPLTPAIDDPKRTLADTPWALQRQAIKQRGEKDPLGLLGVPREPPAPPEADPDGGVIPLRSKASGESEESGDAPEPGAYSRRSRPAEELWVPQETPAPTGSLNIDPSLKGAQQLAALLEELLTSGPESTGPAIEMLRPHGEEALRRLRHMFPGPQWFDRASPHRKLPRGRDVSPVARALVAFGDEAVPFISELLDDPESETRFYATLVVADLQHRDLVAPLGRRVFDEDLGTRALSLDVLRMLDRFQPEFEQTLRSFRVSARLPSRDAEARLVAIRALGELRDVKALALLVELTKTADKDVSRASSRALAVLTKQNFGPSPREWAQWAKDNKARHRIEWLVDALTHPEMELREAAIRELKQLTQQYFGYHAALPDKEREIVQRQYRDWWDRSGRADFSA